MDGNDIRIGLFISVFFYFHDFVLAFKFPAIPKAFTYDEDSALEYWPEFLYEYCGRACLNGNLVDRSHSFGERCPYPDCFPCECGKYCSAKGTCCPTVDETGKVASYDLSSVLPNYTVRLECRSPFYDDTKPNYIYYYYWTVATCPDSWKDEKVKDQCENPDRNTRESLMPTVDRNSGIVFRNIFCQQCNGFSGKHELAIKILCDDQQPLIHTTTNIEFLKHAREFCTIFIDPLKEFPSNKCSPPKGHEFLSHTKLEISVGSKRDEALKSLCRDLPPLLALRVERSKNIFCHLYESRILSEAICPPTSTASSPLTFLWKASKPEGILERKKTCSMLQLETDQGECIDHLCSAGKVLDAKGNICKTPIVYFADLAYTLNITFRVQTTFGDLNGFNYSESFFKRMMNEIGLYHKYIMFTASFLTNCRIGEMDVTIHIRKKSKFGSRDDFEERIITQLTKKTLVIGRTTLYPICIGTELCDIYRSGTRQTGCSTHQAAYIDTREWNAWTNLGQLIDFTPNLICPYMEFIPLENLKIEDSNTTVIYFNISLRNQEVLIEWNYDISFVNGRVCVCFSYLRDLIHQMEESNSHRSDSDVLLAVNYFLDIVCMSVSCVLLLVTIVTYLIFPSLRTTPGLNTMFLCVSLLSANLSLLITSLVGTRGLLTKPHCLFHGIFLHYSWMTSFVWMNACCIHMYRVFTGHRARSRKKYFLWYSLYSFGSPFIIVVLVIIITHVTTDGTSIGYNSDICFMDTTVSVLIIVFGILIPLGFTVLINSILFFLTVREMFQIKKMQRQTKSSHGVWTYTKLSTVTGLFCLLSATGAQFDSVVLSLISTPFAALQGLFIFVSFMANKRIYRMYCQFLLSKRQSCHEEP